MEWRNSLDSTSVDNPYLQVSGFESIQPRTRCDSDAATLRCCDVGDGDDRDVLEKPPAAGDSKISRLRKAAVACVNTLEFTEIAAWFKHTDGPRRYRGWRKAVVAAAIITAVVLLANITLAIVAAAKYGTSAGVGVLYTGDCGLVERWNTALHLLINVLGTCLLSASSFTMQCLSSPTRSETDRAHALRKSLEIGVPSIKNLSHMHWWKGCLWWALCLSTIPLHLFWNSTVFSTLGANDFNYLVVDESFLSGAEYLTPNVTDPIANYVSPSDVSDPAIYLAGYRAGNYTRLEPSECLTTYMAMFVNSRRNFIAVTSPTSGMKMSPGDRFPTYQVNRTEFYGPSVFYISAPDPATIGFVQPLWNGSSVLAYQSSVLSAGTSFVLASQWPCLGWPIETTELARTVCDVDYARRYLRENGTWWLRPWDGLDDIDVQAAQAYPIDYCLAETKGTQVCQLQYVSYILVVVICCNVVKLAAMCATARYLWSKDEPIFATIGDAVSSYMQRPDKMTTGWCLMDLKTRKEWQKGDIATDEEISAFNEVETYQRKPIIGLLQATGKTRWWVTMTACTSYLFLGIGLLVLAVNDLTSTLSSTTNSGTKHSIWTDYGLGKVTNSNLLGVDMGSASKNLVSSILVANSFQLILSMTYFLFNALWTAQCSAMEWASYIAKRKPLRVTWPRGQQRSTYYLNLPYRYGIPLTVMLALIHFLISQSIFLARVKYYNADGSESTKFISDAAYSPLGILVTVCIATILILSMFAHGFRKIDNRIPVHGNSSLVISALCHSVEGPYRNEEGVLLEHPADDMSERKVMWGLVRSTGEGLTFKNEVSVSSIEEQVAGHCAFTADQADPPELGKRYK